jgi:hypothetical protein
MNTAKDGLVIAGVGLVTFAISIFPIYRARRARGWPQTKATVLSSKVTKIMDSGGRNMHPYRVEVLYSYTVRGEAYQSNRLGFFEMPYRHRSEARAEAQRKQYKSRSGLTIYYDPANAAEAVVHTQVPGGFYFVAGVGLFIAVMGLLFAVFAPAS